MKMGPHRMSGRADDLFRDYIARVKPPWVKMLDDWPADLVAFCHGHGTKVVGRVYFGDQSMRTADDAIAEVVAVARAHPGVDAWELWNECHQAHGEGAAYAAISIQFIDAMRVIGRSAAIGSFSVGMPDLAGYWVEYAPALRHAARHNAFLALHQYGGGSQGMKFDPPWFSLRHRQVIAWATATGVPMPQILITESGIDSLDQADIKTRGWKTMPAGYDYAADLAWFCRELGKNPEIIGVTDFGFSTLDPAWQDFDLARDRAMLDRVTQLQAAIPDTAKPVTPAPPKEASMLEQYLDAEFGRFGWDDLRNELPSNPNGPAGDFSARQLSLIDTIAIHHSAGSIDQSWQSIAAYHIGPERGWAGIGYHIGVRNGRVAYLGGIEKGRACVGQLNHRVICCCVTGDYTRVALAQQDRVAIERVVKALQRWSAATLQRQLRVKGHGELPGQSTACPGGAIKAILPGLASITAGGGGVVDAGPSTALLTRAEQHRVIRLNKTAALQKAILRDGFVPVSGEFTEAPYTAQLAESLATGAVRVYYASAANWNNVRYLQR